MIEDLFSNDTSQPALESIGQQAFILRRFALPYVPQLLTELERIIQIAPFRHMHTPGGRKISVAVTNCGELGWISDSRGYRYTPTDPLTKQPWPAIPQAFLRLAQSACHTIGFSPFYPDACLINQYLPGNQLTLHQDKDERDFSAPIVSVSLGIPAVFLFGGLERSDKTQRYLLSHGDVVVWGGVDRLRYHGIQPIKDASHPELGASRINFTLRHAH